MSFDSFFRDKRLHELLDRLKNSDDIHEIISLTENQHSDILAWMFDSREGHGQGDAILKDFLLAVTAAATREDSHLDKRTYTSRFLSAWSVQRIHTTSFASAFTHREVSLASDSRPDLLIVDPQNGFFLVVENKAGARLTSDQLAKYSSSAEQLSQHPMLKGFDRAFIALNRDLDWVGENDQQPASDWQVVSYDWLRSAAERATRQVASGNAAAGLVASYCRQQTDWENEEQRVITRLAASLSLDFDDEIGELVGMRPQFDPKHRLGKQANDGDAEVWTFAQQNRSLIRTLRDVRGLPSVKVRLLERMPYLKADDVDVKRKHMMVTPVAARRMVDDYYTVFFRVQMNERATRKSPSYSVRFCFNGGKLPAEFDATTVRTQLAAIFPALKKYEDSRWRSLEIGRDLDVEGALALIEKFEPLVTEALT